MIISSTLPTRVAPAQLLKATFATSNGALLHIDYHGPQQAFRIRSGALQRLFFFETDFFQKLIWQSEYGVVLGQLTPTKATAGWMRLDTKRYRFAVTHSGTKLSLLHAQTKSPLLACQLGSLPLARQLDAPHAQYFLFCLAFVLAWLQEQDSKVAV